MLARALCLSLAIEVALYATVAHYVADATPGGSALAALTGVLLLRGLLLAVSYAYAWEHRSPAPRLSAIDTLRMVCGEYAAFVFSFLVLFPLERWTMASDRLDPPSGRRRLPVLLVHGYGCSRAAWWWLRRRIEAAGWNVATISLEPVYTSIDDYIEPLARRVDAVLAATGADRLVLVGHSMGGLVARAYLQRHGSSRTARLITLGTPHQGSELAYIGFGANARQMEPGSAWLQALASPTTVLDTVVIYSPHDNFVMPQRRLLLPGARLQAIEGLGHLAMLYSPRVATALLAALADDGSGSAAARPAASR
ncbi:triacylglycerol lipase [Accumulibacter sp.]|uniref:esterase/lipase family protein n=1 Tax=Accumulibacter sp. TaxID=2053492 RepID=UPI0025E170AB|nr:alpha/beta fold hydrolase [Accumulibacter sp.]MCM8595540.1 alpha/beta fold hydrolase [Accumulibacter sp.]MCM8627288.1 alpha/beta fold hydrolase [Accumulibacter sp.]MDS4049687.1 alpha/beta fold hydrolase [Accumulibacter sp.]